MSNRDLISRKAAIAAAQSESQSNNPYISRLAMTISERILALPAVQPQVDAAEADKRAAALDEREACARLIDGFRQERNHIGDQKCAALFRKAYAAIRARGDA